MRRRLNGGLTFIVVTSLLLAACEGVSGAGGPEQAPGQGGEVSIAEIAPTMIATIAETPQVGGNDHVSPQIEVGKVITELSLNNVKDIQDIASMRDDFSKSQVFWYRSSTDLSINQGDKSGLSFLAGFEVTSPDGNSVGQLGWVDGPGDEILIASKLPGELGWVIPYKAGLFEIEGVDDRVAEMYFYDTAEGMRPAYGFNVDNEGHPIPGGVYCYVDEATMQGVCNPMNTGEYKGKTGFTDIPQDLKIEIFALQDSIKKMGGDPSEWVISFNEEWGDETMPGYWLDQDIFMSVDGDIKVMLADGTIAEIQERDVLFDENGSAIIDGYSRDENGGLISSAETVIFGGVTLTLSEADENGMKTVVKMEVKGELSEAEKAKKLAALDPASLGFAAGSTEILYDGQYIRVVSAQDHNSIIAEWNYGKSDFVWDWSMMTDPVTGDNIIMNVAIVEKMNGVNPVDKEVAEENSQEVFDFAYSQPVEGNSSVLSSIYIYNSDRDAAIVGSLVSPKKVTPEELLEGSVSGRIYFKAVSGEIIEIRVKNLSCDKRYWN